VELDWLVEVVGAAALVTTAVAVLPQARRIIRVRSTAGVSPVWAILGVVSTAAWVVYTAFRGLWWATVADALSCAAYTMTVVMLARHGERPRLVAGALWLSVIVFANVLGGLDGLGVVLAIAFLVQVSPSLWTAYRSIDLHGASLSTWMLTCAEGALWATYGAANNDRAVVAFGLVAFSASVLMCLRIRWSDNRRAVRPKPA
jgi:uncharacterized protein with PQ loop repeat